MIISYYRRTFCHLMYCLYPSSSSTTDYGEKRITSVYFLWICLPMFWHEHNHMISPDVPPRRLKSKDTCTYSDGSRYLSVIDSRVVQCLRPSSIIPRRSTTTFAVQHGVKSKIVSSAHFYLVQTYVRNILPLILRR